MITKSIQETRGYAKQILEMLKGKHEGATILALHGDLGAGKTTFTQELASMLGVRERVQSPTFVILKSYALAESAGYKYLIHIDAYRLEDGNDLHKLNWEEYVEDPHNLIVIEWAERVKTLLPEDVVHIDFDHISEGERKIEVRT